jgi:5-methyltetrahydropteroyltriglutamate--homocysteine methyltransferase
MFVMPLIWRGFFESSQKKAGEINMSKIHTQTLGYPRIGKNREMKKALESYWRGDIGEAGLLQTLQQVEREGWRSQLESGIDFIGVGDATLYDHILDWAVRFGIVPERFARTAGLGRYFAMARGAPDSPALELTKWFDTNYHYLVPEFEAGSLSGSDFSDYLERLEEARSMLGSRAVPIVPGPVTLLALSRSEVSLDETLESLLPLYRSLLEEIRSLNYHEVQLHEPALVLSGRAQLKRLCQEAYAEFAELDVAINLVTYFDDLGENYPWVVQLPVQTITLDFSVGDNVSLIKQHGWPQDKTLAAGVVDGRNVWRIRPETVLGLLEELQESAALRVSASSSLQFVPYSAATESNLFKPLQDVLAFAEEKLAELGLLSRAISGEEVNLDFQRIESSWRNFKDFSPGNEVVRKKLRGLAEEDFRRSSPYAGRREQQVQLPLLPTTTIGSFPQTRAVRRLRARYKRGEIDQKTYQAGIDGWIAHSIGVQEGLGLDVLVHGEFERSDMVEYFAEKMQGFAFTDHGWVQSYGNRYVRPPIIYTDVARQETITVREFRLAQSFTRRPVKGMLTGPVTMLNWSYPRTDIPRHEIAFQLALALREEIADLEGAGARVIQVDEPALREGLPLKSEYWADYLSWAIDAFRLATGAAKPETQIHTHMCYAEFGDILQAIDRMDADVISIENARSGDQTLRELAEFGYHREVGPGVYDVHSSVIPQVDEIQEKLRILLKHLRAEQIWVNPDCGLKTRTWDEVIASLRNILAAVRMIREEAVSGQPSAVSGQRSGLRADG